MVVFCNSLLMLQREDSLIRSEGYTYGYKGRYLEHSFELSCFSNVALVKFSFSIHGLISPGWLARIPVPG